MTDTPDRPVVLSAVEDMFFSARIEAVARLVEVNLIQVINAQQLQNRLESLMPGLVILDLNSRTCLPLDAVRRIRADARFAHTRVIGFLSHVQRDLGSEARKAGCDQVMPRSAFSANLQQILESVRKAPVSE
jgi:DNA-binding NarL/FixJ family response regulator